jgi:glutathione peroxidase-family protein
LEVFNEYFQNLCFLYPYILLNILVIDKTGQEPIWNFWKYLISPSGEVITSWGPRENLSKVYQIIREHVEKLNGEEIKDEL